MKYILGLFWLAATAFLHAQVLDFDAAPDDMCGNFWIEEGLTLTAGGVDGDASNCFAWNNDGLVFLAPGQVKVDISGLNITRIEADIVDNTGQGTARLFVTNATDQVLGQVLNTSTEFETLTLMGASGAFIVFEGLETFLTELRIITADSEEQELPDITIEPNPAGGMMVCWASNFNVILERSDNLTSWAAVPQEEIEDRQVRLCHLVDSHLNKRYFYRLMLLD